MFIQKYELKNFRHFLEIHYTLSFVLYGLWYLGNGSLQWTDFLNIDIFLYFHWKWILTYFKLYCVSGKKDREEICMFKFLPSNSENMICCFNMITVLLVLSEDDYLNIFRVNTIKGEAYIYTYACCCN